MRVFFYITMTLCSVLAWSGGVSPLLTQNPEHLSGVAMACVAAGGIALVLFRTRKYLSLISTAGINGRAARFHALLIWALALGTVVVTAIVFYQYYQGQIDKWKNIVLMPFSLFFVLASGWLLRTPSFAKKLKGVEAN